jgi:hypothetical protein
MSEPTHASTIAQLPPPPAGHELEPDPWLTPAADLLAALIDGLAATRPSPPVVPTGITVLDAAEGGLVAGTLTIMCAPPGADRTTPLLSAALHAAAHDHPVIVYALGPATADVAALLGALVSGVPRRRLRADATTDADLAVLSAARRRLADLPLEVMVGQTVSTHDIRAGCLSADDAPALIVVDNHVLLAHGGRTVDLKHLAVDLNVAVLSSTTLPAGTDGAQPAAVDADLLNAGDTLTWAATGRPPVVLFAPSEVTGPTHDDAGTVPLREPHWTRPLTG